MSYIGIGSPIPDLTSLPGQTGGEVEVTLDYPSSSACGDASPFLPSEATPAGGVFSASPAGLNLNTSTGEVTPVGSTPQTYTISYTVSGIISQFALTINVVQQSTFSYSSSSFQQIGTATPTLAGGTTLGGSFSAPAGVSINTSTGVIDLAASTIGGPYTITYTTPGPCASASTFDISVTAVAVELIDNNFAMEFDAASSQYFEITKTSAYTIASLSMWVKVSGNFGVNERQSLSSNDDFNHGRDFIIADTPTTTNEAYIAMVAGAIQYGKTSATGGIPINDGNWHHLVWTYDASAGTSAAINMYVDGQNQYSNATYTSYWSYEVKFQYFGKFIAANAYFGGDMDEVAIWNKVLQLEDVQTIYNATNDNPGKCANLFTAGLGTDLVLWNRMGD